MASNGSALSDEAMESTSNSHIIAMRAFLVFHIAFVTLLTFHLAFSIERCLKATQERPFCLLIVASCLIGTLSTMTQLVKTVLSYLSIRNVYAIERVHLWFCSLLGMLLFFHSLVRLIKVRSRWQFVLRPAHNTAITCTMAAFGGLFELLSWFSYHLSLYLLPVAIFILCLLTIFLYIAMWAVMRSQPERPPGYKALHTTALATLVLLGTLWLPRCTLRLLNTPSPITPDLYGYIPDALHLVFCGVYFFLQRDFIKVNNSVSPADIEVLPESAPSPDRIASLPVIGSKFGGSAESVSAHIVAAVSIANIDQLSNSGRTSQTPLSLNNKHPGKWLSSLIIRPSQTSQSETEVDRSNLILDNLSVK